MPMPSWLRRHLTETGVLDPTGAARRARLRLHDCGRYVFVGLDDDRCADLAVVDTLPLTRLGEAQAIVAGRVTYDHSWLGKRLDPRTAGIIRTHPAGSHRWRHVLAEHRCDDAAVFDFALPRPTEQENLDGKPPF